MSHEPNTTLSTSQEALKEKPGWTWGHGLLVVVIVAMFSLITIFLIRFNSLVNDVQASTRVYSTLQEIASDDMVESAELNILLERIEAAEGRALSYFSLFEGLGFFITVVGLLVALVGIFAGFTFASRLREFREMEKEYTEKIYQIEKDSRNTFEELETNLRDTSQNIQANYNKQLQELEQKWQESVKENQKIRTDFSSENSRLRTRFQEVAAKASLSLSLTPLARQQYQSGDLKGALETYQRAAKLEEEELSQDQQQRINPVLYYHIGYILTNLNQLEEAEVHLEKALIFDENLQHARAALGYVYRRMGDVYDRRAKVQNLSDDERLNTLKKRNDLYAKAAKNLQTALINMPHLIDDDNESWYGALAGLYKRLGEFDKAKVYYKEAAKITPQSSYPVVNLALIRLIEVGDTEEVRELFRDVERLARYELQAELDNYWAYGDLLTAQLVLRHDEKAIRNTLAELKKILPEDNRSEVVPRIETTLNEISDIYVANDQEIPLMEMVLDELNTLYTSADNKTNKISTEQPDS